MVRCATVQHKDGSDLSEPLDFIDKDRKVLPSTNNDKKNEQKSNKIFSMIGSGLMIFKRGWDYLTSVNQNTTQDINNPYTMVSQEDDEKIDKQKQRSNTKIKGGKTNNNIGISKKVTSSKKSIFKLIQNNNSELKLASKITQKQNK